MGSPVLRSEKLKGARFGAHEIVRLLGHGATASVFEATHVALRKPVAVKILHDHHAANEQLTRRFLREGRVAAQLAHPNIVGVFDVGVESGVPYLVMELLRGTDLRTLLAEEHTLPLERALALLLPIASALVHAHEAGVIHRDLKPANVVLSRDMRGDVVPKLVDFGLSKAISSDDPSSSLTATELVSGRLAYTAPEQTSGAQSASPASDQYALAAILYETLTGAPPFEAEGVDALIEAMRVGTARAPSHADGRLPRELDALVLRALSHDPAQRFAAVRDFGRALLPFADDATRSALAPDFSETTSVRPPLPEPIAPEDARARSSAEVEATETRAESAQPDVATLPAQTPVAPALAPLPCRAGRSPFRIKGMAYRGFVDHVGKALPGGLDALCEALDDEQLRAFVRQRFLATERYDILPFVPLCGALARLRGVPFDSLVAAAATTQARYDARTVFKRIFEGATVDDIAERIGRFSAQYYNFGKCVGAVPEPGVLWVEHAPIPEYIAPWFGPMHMAYTAESARLAGAREILETRHTVTPAGANGRFPVVRARTDLRWR